MWDEMQLGTRYMRFCIWSAIFVLWATNLKVSLYLAQLQVPAHWWGLGLAHVGWASAPP